MLCPDCHPQALKNMLDTVHDTEPVKIASDSAESRDFRVKGKRLAAPTHLLTWLMLSIYPASRALEAKSGASSNRRAPA